MRVAIVGAGAIGCYFAAKLAAAGTEVVVLARGPTLEAIRRSGIAVQGKDNVIAQVRAIGSPEEAQPADLVISCVKAYSIPALAPAIAQMLAPEGAWLCAVNGLPWWYAQDLAGPLSGLSLSSVDPSGSISATIGPGRTLGCVVYLASEATSPGVIRFGGGRGLVVGEPGAQMTRRLERACSLLREAGITTRETVDIRSAVWNKLFGNVSLNPLSALTGLTVEGLLADTVLKAFLTDVVGEVQGLAAKAGCPPETSAEARVMQMAALGPFRSSMLQDAEAGRPLEHEAIIGAVVELAQKLAVPLPRTELLWALIRSFAESRGLDPQSQRRADQ